jgi:glucose/arabinose dehydrogenase
MQTTVRSQTLLCRRIVAACALLLAAASAPFTPARVMGQAACTGFQVSGGSATPDPVAPGGTETITAQVCAGGAATNVLIDLEIYGPNGAQVAQRIFAGETFAARQTKAYRWDYAVPATLAAGTYTVKVGVFSGDWGTLHRWENQADTFTVGGSPPAGCAGGVSILPTVAAPDPVAPGRTETITAQVCAGSAATNLLIDLEIYGPTGAQVAQRTFAQEPFTAGQTKAYRWDYAVPATLAPGTYTVKVGVFSGDWRTLHRWENQADTFTVGGSPPAGCAGGVSILPTVAAPDPVAPGRTETITAQVCAGSAATNLIDLEISGPAGAQVAQRIFAGETFAAGQTKAYRWDYAVPATLAPGTYTAKVGVFSGDWGTLHRWDNQAAVIHVGTPPISLVPVVTGLFSPVALAHAGDERLFIVQRTGQILIYSGGRVLPTPFLDISDRVRTFGEQGLASIAFDPNYARTGHFYVFYTVPDADPVSNPGGHIRISRFTVSPGDTNVADPASEAEVLTVPHVKSAEHYGGQLQFGPDGYLYISTGDGGHVSGGPPDPDGNAQNLRVLLGKILRLDVSALPYTVPADNPFAGTAGARPEIWALGLRNPWRFSFDRVRGDLLIADVGERTSEEVNLAEAGSAGGANYGWSPMEGFDCFPIGTTSCQGIPGLTRPMLVYGHAQGDCAIVGGYVYRGTDPSLAHLRGAYVFGDYCSGRIWASAARDGTRTELLDSSATIVAFGEDAAGELYVVHYPATGSGTLYRLRSTTSAP